MEQIYDEKLYDELVESIDYECCVEPDRIKIVVDNILYEICKLMKNNDITIDNKRLIIKNSIETLRSIYEVFDVYLVDCMDILKKL